ncbi:MAG: hypothetical protein K6L75_14160 [Cellvibrionaceae bacterium]
MGTINKNIFEKSGATGCSNSDYDLAITNCCHKFLVVDSELHDIYFDATNLKNKLGVLNQKICPICKSENWDFEECSELPSKNTTWKWAYNS